MLTPEATVELWRTCTDYARKHKLGPFGWKNSTAFINKVNIEYEKEFKMKMIDRIKSLEEQLDFSNDQWKLEVKQKYKLQTEINNLSNTVNWLTKLVNTLADTMHATAKKE